MSTEREWLSNLLHSRVTALAVFVASICGVVALEFSTRAHMTVAAVTSGTSVEHPSPLRTHVLNVHVRAGQRVAAGELMVTLAPTEVLQTLAELDREIDGTGREASLSQQSAVSDAADKRADRSRRVVEAQRNSDLARAQLDQTRALLENAEAESARLREQLSKKLLTAEQHLEAERRLAEQSARATEARARVGAELAHLNALRKQQGPLDGVALAEATGSLYEARLALLRERRRGLEGQLLSLSVRANRDGVVAHVLSPGESVAAGTSVASVVPARASEVVAYLPPESNPNVFKAGANVLIAQAEGNSCTGALPKRLGASVEAAPGQLATAFGGTVYGLPVHLDLPDNCAFGVGQVVQVTFEVP